MMETNNKRQSLRLKEIQELEKNGELYSQKRDYHLSYKAYARAASKAKELGLERIYADYMIKAGDAAWEEGGWIYIQTAADCYAYAGDRKRVDRLLERMHYKEEDITGGSWMGMARTLADINRRIYGNDR
jgi:hypothetical protein